MQREDIEHWIAVRLRCKYDLVKRSARSHDQVQRLRHQFAEAADRLTSWGVSFSDPKGTRSETVPASNNSVTADPAPGTWKCVMNGVCWEGVNTFQWLEKVYDVQRGESLERRKSSYPESQRSGSSGYDAARRIGRESQSVTAFKGSGPVSSSHDVGNSVVSSQHRLKAVSAAIEEGQVSD